MKLKWHKPNTASQMQEMNGQKMIIFLKKCFPNKEKHFSIGVHSLKNSII